MGTGACGARGVYGRNGRDVGDGSGAVQPRV